MPSPVIERAKDAALAAEAERTARNAQAEVRVAEMEHDQALGTVRRAFELDEGAELDAWHHPTEGYWLVGIDEELMVRWRPGRRVGPTFLVDECAICEQPYEVDVPTLEALGAVMVELDNQEAICRDCAGPTVGAPGWALARLGPETPLEEVLEELERHHEHDVQVVSWGRDLLVVGRR
jgi:hypothetical protein